jgi:hypothetical protein
VQVEKPSWRKPAGIGLILLLIACWAVLVTTVFEWIEPLPWPVHAVYFIVAGIAWIAPLKPLLRWMETGRWRAPRK